MRSSHRPVSPCPLSARLVVFVLGALCAASVAHAAPTVSSIKPQFLPPLEILQFLGAHPDDGAYVVPTAPGAGDVIVRVQDTSNLLVLQGEAADVTVVEDLIRAADVAPRQILLDAQIVEVNENRARNAGIEWPQASQINASYFGERAHTRYDSKLTTDIPGLASPRETRKTTASNTRGYAAVSLSATLHLLDEAHASRTRTVPRLVTLNNRRATILDGTRAVYLARYGALDGLLYTDSLDAGITVSVLPSLGESGYLRLSVRAEMSQPAWLSGDNLGKTGQMIENEVIAKADEPVLLGGFDSESTSRGSHKFPILGSVLPFLFSSKETARSSWHTYLVLTPHVVDLAPTVGDATGSPLRGK